jgi:hypothetical protein
MSSQTVVRILQLLFLALLVSGVLFPLAQSWGGPDGIRALWTATGIVFLSMAVGRFVTGILREAGTRPEGAPSASQVGLRIALLLVVLACFPVFVLARGPTEQFAVWLCVHLIAQLALYGVQVARSLKSAPRPASRDPLGEPRGRRT